jgi:hypothetical protein
MPGLYAGTADQVTPLSSNFFTNPTSSGSAQLPVSQQVEVLAPLTGGKSGGLLFDNPSPLRFSGLLSPIPYETTKAQLGTGGSSTDRAMFELSGPAGGKPGETLVAWVLTLPPGQTFARHNRIDIVSQSRQELVQDVNYYPDAVSNPLMRNIAYQPGADNNPDNPSIGAAGPSPCASAAAECMIVKFQPPGLGANDSISFSKSIVKSILFSKGILSGGGAPITNNDLCKAKITYLFSDGFMTTSNFGRCPAVSLPLIASSWRPDRSVAPQILKTNVLLADSTSSVCPGTPPDPNHPDQCGELILTDAKPSDEGGQLGQSCDNGKTQGTISTGGVIKGNVTVSAGQTCNYSGANCEIRGNLNIAPPSGSLPGGSVYLNCELLGVLNDNGGARLTLDASATVRGNVNITNSSAFTIAGADIVGNLNITGATGTQQGSVSGATVTQNVTVQGSQTQNPIQITGNTIQGSLICTGNNPVPASNSNTVGQTNNCTH